MQAMSTSSAFTARPCFTGHPVTSAPPLPENGPNGTTRIEGVEEAGVLTVQLGDGPALAAATGIDVVFDLRAADCAAGGQGAPLAPAYHRALAAMLPQRRRSPSSISAASPTSPGSARDGRLIAFDTGPGNAMIDDWMKQRTDASHDEHGAAAAAAACDEEYVAAYLKPFLFRDARRRNRSTATRFSLDCSTSCRQKTAPRPLRPSRRRAIARAREHFPDEPALWIVSGGGRRNSTLMGMIAGHVENAVVPAEAVGLDGDGLEAEAWAYSGRALAERAADHFSRHDGRLRPLTGGRLARAPK